MTPTSRQPRDPILPQAGPRAGSRTGSRGASPWSCPAAPFTCRNPQRFVHPSHGSCWAGGRAERKGSVPGKLRARRGVHSSPRPPPQALCPSGLELSRGQVGDTALWHPDTEQRPEAEGRPRPPCTGGAPCRCPGLGSGSLPVRLPSRNLGRSSKGCFFEKRPSQSGMSLVEA